MSALKKTAKKVLSCVAKKVIGLANKKTAKTKNILLFCNSDTMIPHLLKYYNAVKDIDCCFYLFMDSHYGNSKSRLNKAAEIAKGTDIIPIAGTKVYTTKWELIVIPDLFLPPYFDKQLVPVLYINHGSHMVSVDDGENTYAYSNTTFEQNGQPKCTAMLEANSRIAELLCKQDKWKNIIKPVGCKDCDEIIAAMANRDEYRKQLGIAQDEIFVMCFGSWRKHSLFHYIDDSFFLQAQELMNKGYVFGLSIHPGEYKRYSDTQEPKGEYIDSMADKGFIIRKPSQDYIPYMIAADIVITDFSTMSEIAILCDKKLILSEFPKGRVWKHSMTAKLKEISPILYDDSDLEQLLNKVVNTDVCKAQSGFKQEIFVSSGEYKQKVLKVTKQLLKIGDSVNE